MSVTTVMVSGSFWPREGGAERQLREILALLSDQGADAAVVSQVLEGSPRREFAPGAKIAIHRVGSRTAFAIAPRFGHALFVLAATWRALRLRPDVLVSLQFGAATVAASMAARILRIRHIIRLTGGGSATFRSEAEARASTPIGRILVRIGAGGTQKTIVAPAQHLLDDLQEFFPHSTCV